MVSLINGTSLAKIDYISIADPYTLEELSVLSGPALASLAVRFGKTRLIDNILLD
jgi:pantoate--beta-alanine ligase